MSIPYPTTDVECREIIQFPSYCFGADGSVWSWRKTSCRWKQLRPYRSKTGYLSVTLWTNRVPTRKFVHRLVLEAFVGPCPTGLECRHLDGDPSNNRLDNLRWGTRLENVADTIRHGRRRTSSKPSVPSPVVPARIPVVYDIGKLTDVVEYREIPRFTGYRFGSDGSAWSRWCKIGLGWGYGSKSHLGDTWHKIKPVLQSNGYFTITIKNVTGGKRRTASLHCLILEAFAGPCPTGMLACHFPDQTPTNNNISNLRWDTPSSNWADKHARGTATKGESHPMAKLNSSQVREIRRLRSLGLGQDDIAARFKVSRPLISKICRYELWADV
jgi:HNH endonuclease